MPAGAAAWQPLKAKGGLAIAKRNRKGSTERPGNGAERIEITLSRESHLGVVQREIAAGAQVPEGRPTIAWDEIPGTGARAALVVKVPEGRTLASRARSTWH